MRSASYVKARLPFSFALARYPDEKQLHARTPLWHICSLQLRSVSWFRAPVFVIHIFKHSSSPGSPQVAVRPTYTCKSRQHIYIQWKNLTWAVAWPPFAQCEADLLCPRLRFVLCSFCRTTYTSSNLTVSFGGAGVSFHPRTYFVMEYKSCFWKESRTLFLLAQGTSDCVLWSAKLSKQEYFPSSPEPRLCKKCCPILICICCAALELTFFQIVTSNIPRLAVYL